MARHFLDKSQLAMEAVQKTRQGEFETLEQAAKALRLSPRLVDQASKVFRKGCKALITAVKCGEVSVGFAFTLSGLSHEQQADALKEIRAASHPAKRAPRKRSKP